MNFVSKKIFQKFLPDLNLLIAMFTNTSSITLLFLIEKLSIYLFFRSAFFRYFFSSNIYFPVDLTGILFWVDFDACFCNTDLFQHFMIKSFFDAKIWEKHVFLRLFIKFIPFFVDFLFIILICFSSNQPFK